MGDRIAVLQKGGVLAQYATPEELLVQPGERVRRGLRRRRPRAEAPLAPARPGHRPLEGAAVRVGEPSPVAATRGGLPRSARRRRAGGERAPASASTADAARVELDDVLRDALSDLLRSETQYGAVVDDRGAVVACSASKSSTTPGAGRDRAPSESA